MKTLILAGLIGLSILTRANTNLPQSSSNDSVVIKTEAFDPELATQQYLDTLSPEAKQKSDSYFEGGYWLILWNLLYGVAVAWVFLSLGLSHWIKGLANKVKNINIQNLIYIGLYLLFAFLLTFPLSVYEGFIREHQYNLSNLTFSGWFGEEIKGLIISIVFGSLILMLIYIAIRKVQENWWIWASGIAFFFVVFGMFIGPVFISPIFNKYQTLEEGQLKNEILSMARANGVPADNVYQFDASKQSNRISANVSGIGSTIRVSLNDNLLKRCTPAQIKSVMGHEIGHYVLNHVYKGMVLFAIIILIGFAFVNWALLKSISRWGGKWSITSISDIGSLPLFIVIFSIFFLFATPVFNNFSRTIELESDYFGLNASQEPDGFASVDMMLSEYRKISPGPLEEILFFDHPSGKVRVHNAMTWKAELLNKEASTLPKKE
jgi:STE24 endopeptidase